MNGTTYTVVMSTNQATNGANIIAAINAGSLATATYASGTVTVTAGSAILLTTPSMYNSTTQLGIEPVPVQSTPMDIDVSNATSLLFHLYITFGTSYPNVPYFKVMSRPYGIETKTGSATYMGYYNLPQVNAVSINSVICNTGSNTTQSKVIGGSMDPTDSNYYAFGYTQTRQLSLVVDVPVGGLQLVVPFICMTNAYDPATANPTRLISLLYQTVYK
jgi:hypothetical protein